MFVSILNMAQNYYFYFNSNAYAQYALKHIFETIIYNSLKVNTLNVSFNVSKPFENVFFTYNPTLTTLYFLKLLTHFFGIIYYVYNTIMLEAKISA